MILTLSKKEVCATSQIRSREKAELTALITATAIQTQRNNGQIDLQDGSAKGDMEKLPKNTIKQRKTKYLCTEDEKDKLSSANREAKNRLREHFISRFP